MHFSDHSMVFFSNVRIAMDFSPPLPDFKSESSRLFLDFPLLCDVTCERSFEILYHQFIMPLLGISLIRERDSQMPSIESVHFWNLYIKEIK